MSNPKSEFSAFIPARAFGSGGGEAVNIHCSCVRCPSCKHTVPTAIDAGQELIMGREGLEIMGCIGHQCENCDQQWGHGKSVPAKIYTFIDGQTVEMNASPEEIREAWKHLKGDSKWH